MHTVFGGEARKAQRCPSQVGVLGFLGGRLLICGLGRVYEAGSLVSHLCGVRSFLCRAPGPFLPVPFGDRRLGPFLVAAFAAEGVPGGKGVELDVHGAVQSFVDLVNPQGTARVGGRQPASHFSFG